MAPLWQAGPDESILSALWQREHRTISNDPLRDDELLEESVLMLSSLLFLALRILTGFGPCPAWVCSWRNEGALMVLAEVRVIRSIDNLLKFSEKLGEGDGDGEFMRT